MSVEMDEEEQAAMSDLLRAYNRILKEWRLEQNDAELAAAVHVIQGFIVQHMLNRLNPSHWSSWYATDEESAGTA